MKAIKDKGAEARKIMPHLASIVNPIARKERSISNMETLPGVMTTANSAKSGRMKVDAKGMGLKKKIVKKALRKAMK